MLAKLVKHEFKVLGRTFIPLCLAVFALGLLGAVVGNIFIIDITNPSPITGLLVFITGFLFLFIVPAGMFLPFVISAVRFWQGFLSSEGYLMFTLPMTRRNLILSKLIPATLWIAITAAVASVSAVIVAISMTLVTVTQFSDLFYLVPQIPNYLDLPYIVGSELVNPILLFCAQSISLIVAAAGGILSSYLAMAIAQLSNSARVFIAIGAWLGLLFAYFIGAVMVSIFWEALLPSLAANALITLIMSSIGTFAACVVMFVVTEQILSKRLNLQ